MCSIKFEVCCSKVCVKCLTESCISYVKYFNHVVGKMWVTLRDLCADIKRWLEVRFQP